MKVTYIGHSGFLIELKECNLIFDYYKGKFPQLSSGTKKVFVFSSHSHGDHYNPQIFSLLQAQGIQFSQIVGILSKDIYVKKIPEGLDYIYVRPDSEYQLSCSMSLKTFHSTDRGVAFLLNTEEGQLYHAGDLNDWQLKDESKQYNHNMSARYQREIQKIKECRIDVAFLPLDPRQEEYYGKGMEYFLQNIPVRHVYPMHYWEHPEVIERFCREHPEYREIIRDTEHTVRQEVSIH